MNRQMGIAVRFKRKMKKFGCLTCKNRFAPVSFFNTDRTCEDTLISCQKVEQIRFSLVSYKRIKNVCEKCNDK